MVDSHNKSFFGNTVGMILDSTAATEPSIFLTFLRKKQDNSWEKPSINEGKKINLNLEEMVWMLEVLHHREAEWSTVHKFGEVSTKISLSWVKDQKDKEKVCIQANGYKKYLNFAESIILTKLLEHLLDEKIVHSTVPIQKARSNGKLTVIKPEIVEERTDFAEEPTMPVVVEEVITPDAKKSEIQTVLGVVQGETDKALRITFESGKELWIPKSTIHSSYDSTSEKIQRFSIDIWILKKNNIVE